MKAEAFIDTNVLLYSLSRRPEELSKRDAARQLLQRRDLGLSVQVVQEFYVNATRKVHSTLSHQDAIEFVTTLKRFPWASSDAELFFEAVQIRDRYGFSYWDSAIVAAAKRLGCRRLFSEDFQHGQRIGDLEVIDPFAGS